MEASQKRKYHLLTLLLFFIILPGSLVSQTGLNFYTDAGTHNVSNGFYLKSAFLGTYSFNENRIGLAIQTDLKSPSQRIFTAYKANYSRAVILKDLPFEAEGYFIYSDYSDIFNKINTGLLADLKLKHTVQKLGIDFRRFGYTKEVAEQYSIDHPHRGINSWKVILYYGAYIKPIDNFWNMGLVISNMDHFVITNTSLPSFSLQAKYDTKPGMTLYLESWFKVTGFTTISFNPYNYFFRTGISWEI